jgi:Ca2+-binding EF-hand superfamily protein
MGAGTSTLLAVDAQRLSKAHNISPAACARLHKRFHMLDKSGDGSLDQEDLDLMSGGGLVGYDASIRAVIAPLFRFGFAKDADGKLTFECFLQTLALFARGQPLEPKLRFVFALMSGGAMEVPKKQMMSVATATCLPPGADADAVRALQKRVDACFAAEGGADGAAAFTFDMFVKVLRVHVSDLEDFMAIDL